MDMDVDDPSKTVKVSDTAPDSITTAEKSAADASTVKSEGAGNGEDIPSKPHERLEVPSKELQCIQKQVLIEKMSLPTRRSRMNEDDSATGKDNNSILKSGRYPKKLKGPPEPRKTFKLESSVLSKVKSFLPQIKTANDDLLTLPDPSRISLQVDVEDEMDNGPKPGPSGTAKITEKKETPNSKTLVEMNIALVENSDSDTSSDGEGEDFKIKMDNKPSNTVCDSLPSSGNIESAIPESVRE